ncbi:TPA: transposase [Pseudomonas aeruginosa]|nr:transposase [Pseudomonas aeruginosa]KAB0708634.1 transposase [Pseudomonas aeruginosa]MBY5270526.1 transposase [Pseudomonas aeruginosa]MCO2128623.1 transposase [Pseudomonas aeruginosa]MCO2538545.1 transposase [Pseudomonas aeruginosa]
MPRQGRVVLPNYPLHVVQRGHNRQVVFAEDEDYQRYLSDPQNLEDAFDNKLHAFCRMTTHIHLLLAACRPSFLLPRSTAPQCTSTPETAVSR